MGKLQFQKSKLKKKINIIKKNITHKLNIYEKQISSWNKKSFVSIFNQYKANQPKLIDQNLKKIILTGLCIGKKTHGALDITIGNLINMWGFGPGNKILHYPSIEKIKNTIQKTGIQNIQLIQNISGTYITKNISQIKINLSTMGEGFAAEEIKKILKNYKIKNYIISIGGVVISHSIDKNKIIPVGILSPFEKENTINTIVNLNGKSISTSGVYHNYYKLNNKKISHLINPVTGKPINNSLLSVSIISNSALEADAWDTALMILGFKEAKKIAIFEKLSVCLIKKEKKYFSIWYSPEFKKFLL
ncbi:FAD:protein FMN transferase [Buchnera aphidicola]|uniref:FAD:protein FMN transferase n=1 Tax=Buchnera aphidicola TaxID=9 RepID=UPI0034649F47